MVTDSNIKDKITGVCFYIGLLGVIMGVIIGSMAASSVTIPIWLAILASSFVAIPAVVGLYFNGKNPNGSTKTPTQVITQNKIAEETKTIPAAQVKV